MQFKIMYYISYRFNYLLTCYSNGNKIKYRYYIGYMGNSVLENRLMPHDVCISINDSPTNNSGDQNTQDERNNVT